jgi:hypothetical protein
VSPATAVVTLSEHEAFGLAVAGALERALASPPPAGAGAGVPGWDEGAARTAAPYDQVLPGWPAS